MRNKQKTNVTIIGLGLLGTSLGLALAGKYHRTAWARRKESLDYALKTGAVDEVFSSPSDAVSNAEITVICLPVKKIIAFVGEHISSFRKGSLVTDVGSIKKTIIENLFYQLRDREVEFVGSHPMAGSEQSGAEAASSKIYSGATVYITPVPENSADAVNKISRMWKDAGGRTLPLSPEEHDKTAAVTSHLVHIAAAMLTSAVLDCGKDEFQRRLRGCAGGFRDSTRVAASNPEMWEEIIELNSANIIPHLRELEKRICEIRKCLEAREFGKAGEILKKAAGLKKKAEKEKQTGNSLFNFRLPISKPIIE
jgi:prephenate dehydrogenase